MPMSHVSVAYFSPCHMSPLRKAYVACHFLLRSMALVMGRGLTCKMLAGGGGGGGK